MTLQVDNLSIQIGHEPILRNVSFTTQPGERTGIIGASGSGKTMLSFAIMGLLPPSAQVSGEILLDGTNILALSDEDRAALRGDRIGMVFQEPKTALNPLMKLGAQITESLNIHYRLSRDQRREAALKLAHDVGLDDVDRILAAYPHEVSGGQRQRVAIAAAIAANPQLLIADEPTTALDVSVQRSILDLFVSLSERKNTTLLFITHDIAVLNRVASHAIVLDQGEIVETGLVSSLISQPSSTITQRLVDAARVSSWRQGNHD